MCCRPAFALRHGRPGSSAVRRPYIGEISLLSLTTLASGSSGNSLLVSDGRTHILIDAGISARRITKSLRELGIDPGQLSGILITHEHSDHICGLNTLTKQFAVPVYASKGTGRQLCYRIAFLEDRLRDFEAGAAFEIGGLAVESFPTPHDTAESVGYAVSAGGRKAAVVTDLGRVTEEVSRGIRDVNLLVAETNYDPEWLQSGPYPYYLKERIQGDWGHLSNQAGAELACSAVENGASTIILAHLSKENNTPARAYDTVLAAMERRGIRPGDGVRLEVAPRSETGMRWEV